MKIAPQRQADIRRFWQEERDLTDPALLARAHRFSGVYPRYRDLKYLKSQLKVDERPDMQPLEIRALSEHRQNAGLGRCHTAQSATLPWLCPCQRACTPAPVRAERED